MSTYASCLAVLIVAHFLVAHRLQAIGASFDRLDRFLSEEIATKKAEIATDIRLDGAVSKENKNLFGRFVAASEQEGARGLSVTDIKGNLFIFMLAGVSQLALFLSFTILRLYQSLQHDTTAHSLVATLAFLAMNQTEQERIHKYICSTIGDSEPVSQSSSPLVGNVLSHSPKKRYEDYNALLPVLHCFYETVRLYRE